MKIPMLLLIGVWVFFGVINYGCHFASLQAQYPEIAEMDYQQDRTFAAVWGGVGGPISFLILLAYGDLGYGWRWK